MFDLRIIGQEPLIKFNRQLPYFNWHYPFAREEDLIEDRRTPYLAPTKTQVRRRAIYVHIPFCETICSFCPFGRDKLRPDSDVAQYLSALVAEMDLKREFIGRPKLDAIFVGGGTPSVLGPREIEALGEAILRNFDLHALSEFTFEVEAKSVSREKLQAMCDIGVNRVSFGAQTFSQKYRALFSLDATLRQVTDAAALLNSMFPYTNVDLLYGMAGQDSDELTADVMSAVSLRTTTIDVYPINNLTASRAMHVAAARAGLDLLPESTRVQFRILLDRLFQELGYQAISGYSFALANNTRDNPLDPVQHEPKFLYHDMVYGYDDDEIIGYGSSAISRMPGFNIYNFAKRQAYVSEVLTNRALPHLCFGPIVAPERGIVYFPYRGTLQRSLVNWDRVPHETLAALQEALEAGLILDHAEKYVLTKVGWLFYVNLMYYLMPSPGKLCLSERMELQERNGRGCGKTDLTEWARSG
jgi:coproporphyrinogen III oxidase-like Fe-S oxidoreductase